MSANGEVNLGENFGFWSLRKTRRADSLINFSEKTPNRTKTVGNGRGDYGTREILTCNGNSTRSIQRVGNRQIVDECYKSPWRILWYFGWSQRMRRWWCEPMRWWKCSVKILRLTKNLVFFTAVLYTANCSQGQWIMLFTYFVSIFPSRTNFPQHCEFKTTRMWEEKQTWHKDNFKKRLRSMRIGSLQ